MYIGLQVKCRYSFQTLMKLEFSRIRKKKQISNFIKIRPVGGNLFYADRQTDRHQEANSRFSHFFERA